MKTPIRVSCQERDWQNVARDNLAAGSEVDLVNFNADYDAELCKGMAQEYGMTFESKPKLRAGHFKKLGNGQRVEG